MSHGRQPLRYTETQHALRKIRIDLKIPIQFAGDDIRPLRGKAKRCAVARIRYSEVDRPCKDGVLILESTLFRAADAIQGILAAQVHAIAGNGRRGDEHVFTHPVGREHFELLAHLHYDDIALLGRDVDLSFTATGEDFKLYAPGSRCW
jgi:hypothetical protein